MVLWYRLDKDKNPVPVDYPGDHPEMIIYHKWLQKNRIVKKSYIGGMEVSTVFLGLDHSLIGDGIPVLWETMIFGEVMGEDWEYQWRYTSHKEALEGHAEVCRTLERKLQKQLDWRKVAKIVQDNSKIK